MPGGPDDDTPAKQRLVRYPLTDDIRLTAYARHYECTVSDLLRLAVRNLLDTLDTTRPMDEDFNLVRRRRKG